MFCGNCGKELPEGSLFCSECGAKIEPIEMDEEKTKVFVPEEEVAPVVNEPESAVSETSAVEEAPVAEKAPVVEEAPIAEEASAVVETPVAEEIPVVDVAPAVEEQGSVFCPNCGEKNDLDSLFCSGCGYKFGQDVFSAANDKKTDEKKKSNKKAAKVIGIIAAAVIFIGLIGFAAYKLIPMLMSGADKSNSYTLYYDKDNSVFTTKKDVPKLVFDKHYDDYDYFNTIGAGYGKQPQLSNDGKYLFYLKRINDSYEGDLYFQKKDKLDTEDKIASSVRAFYALTNNTVLYITDDDKLYVSDLKGNKEKISSEINDFILADNEKNVLFTERDGSDIKLYVYELGKKNADKNKLATITDLCGVSADNNTIVYMKDDSLYVLTNFADEDKIDSDVTQCYTEVDGNKVSIYYATEIDEKNVSVYDLVNDDMYEADKNTVEPNIDDYQRVTVKDSFWGPRETVETDDSYYDDYDKFQQKQSRDYLRDRLKGYSDTYYEMEFFCYEVGSKEPVSLGKYDAESPTSVFMRCGKGIYNAYSFNTDNEATVKLSDIYNNSVDYSMILSDTFRNSHLYLVIDKDVYQVENSKYMDEDSLNVYSYSFSRNPSSGKVYYAVSVKNSTEVYEVKAAKGELSFESYMDDVDMFSVLGRGDGNYAFCDMNNKGTSADLYINGERVDSDVYPSLLNQYPNDGDLVFYVKDYDDGNGELNVYDIKSKKSKKIDSDVHLRTGVAVVGDNEYVYITDFSDRSQDGDLMLYKGNEAKKIDSDVDGFCVNYYSFSYGKEAVCEYGTMTSVVKPAYVPAAEEAEAAPAAEAW